MALAVNLAPAVIDALCRPRRRPLALCGRTRCGKTTLLRSAARRAGRQTVWCSAFDMANELAEAIWGGVQKTYSEALMTDSRPLCVEHLEDLREKPRTREELCRLLKVVARHRPVVLTLTRTKGDIELVAWLRSWAELRRVG